MPYFKSLLRIKRNKAENAIQPEPGISGLEKRAPSGEQEYFARSN